ncbi:uncharacterized protein LOC133471300 [Phyllopteryx taeniolatus]|uniref:uncharacterized protein LOC133471300 n=1 Tax=Phyllopteryx taeniolatus TaxID=161469 RepID=UPI002AD59237|nr:uncharacterized protein LOC133471300 [Phyllopteryx taeniolatus]
MACGIYLGVFLICFLQAEHVRCLWASREAQGKTYVGFVQDYDGAGGPRRDGGTGKAHQNQFRQAAQARASVQSGSGTGVSVDSYQRSEQLSSQGGYSSLKVVRRRPVAAPLKKAVPVKPERAFLSTAIASSGSLSRFKPHTGLKKPISGDHSKSSSSLFATGYGKRKFLANMQTSAKGAAVKVSIGQKPGRHQKKTYNYYNRGQVGVQSKKEQWASGGQSDRQRYAPTNVLIIPNRYGGVSIRRLKDPASQKTQRGALHKPATSWAHSGTKWARIKLRP